MKIRNLCLVIVILMVTQIMPVKAEENVNQYSTYSNWANQTGFKYQIISNSDVKRYVTRAEVAQIIYNTVSNEKIIKKSKPIFSDISYLTDEEQESILYLSSKGIIKGYPDGTFRPKNDVTRAEFVYILDMAKVVNGMGLKEYNFEDINMHWAKKSIIKCYSDEIISGESDIKFSPDSGITVEQILLILDRLSCKKIIEEQTVSEIMRKVFGFVKYDGSDAYFVEKIYPEMYNVQKVMETLFDTYIKSNYYDYRNINSILTHYDLAVTRRLIYNTHNLWISDNYDERMEDLKQELVYISENKKKWSDDIIWGEANYMNVIDSLGGKVLDKSKEESYECITEKLKCLYQNSNNASFSNWDSFNERQKEIMNFLVKAEVLPDYTGEFPADKPATKAFVNYLFCKVAEVLEYQLPTKIRDEYDVEFDINKFPSNYTDYPLIVKGMDKEEYQLRVLDYAVPELRELKLPTQWYKARYNIYGGAITRLQQYFNTILNVDYETINTKFIDDISSTILYNEDTFLEQYVDYVRVNKIKIKGEAKILFPVFYQNDSFYRARVKIKFEVISANEIKDLIYGNKSDEKAIYDRKYYEGYVDMPLCHRLFTEESYVVSTDLIRLLNEYNKY